MRIDFPLETASARQPAVTDSIFDLYLGEEAQPPATEAAAPPVQFEPLTVPARTQYPFLTGEAARRRAGEIATAAWEPPGGAREPSARMLSDVVASGTPRIVGVYGNLIIAADDALPPERLTALLTPLVAAIEEGARHGSGRRMLAQAQAAAIPLVIALNESGRNSYTPGERSAGTVGANFDTIAWDPRIGGADRDSAAIMPPWLVLYHEIGHFLLAEDVRRDSLAGMAEDARRLFPHGNMFALPAADRLHADVLDALGRPVTGGNGIRDDEDRVLVDYEWPLAAEAGLVSRPDYGAITAEELILLDPMLMQPIDP